MTERWKNESPELAEKDPEVLAGKAIEAIEFKDASDKVISKGWVRNAVDYSVGGLRNTGEFTTGSLGKAGLFLGIITFIGLKVIEKSAVVIESALKNPDSPKKWFTDFKASFKGGDKKDK